MRLPSTKHILVALALIVPAAFGSAVLARGKKPYLTDDAVRAVQSRQSTEVPAAGTLEVTFSPNEGSEALVVKAIDSARSEILVLSYSFTSAPVTAALLRARHRGVAVKLVADHKNNVTEDRSGKARAALPALADAGADVRTISAYPIHTTRICWWTVSRSSSAASTSRTRPRIRTARTSW